jgi:lipoprotein signal peptidase
VIDFLDFYWKNHQWAAFNVADMAIFLGAFLYLAAGLMEKMRKYPRVIPLYEKAENEAIHGKNSGWNPYGK